ncbi:MAG TPA: hypothetical protein P5556_04245 [Candidatus Gastranaerophilales bacterium]|nr:hypothetical protein [Candidatus Gastranaerophilales bacterium]
MGFADAVAGRQFVVARKSDLEFQLSMIMERKLAILDECNQISQTLSNSIFQSGLHNTITSPTATPGFIAPSPVIPPAVFGQSPYGTGEYEQRLSELQGIEKALDLDQKKKESELEAIKAEEESLKKIADDHAKKDFKLG